METPTTSLALSREDPKGRLQQITAVGELLSLNGRSFVDATYHALLKRSPDDAGLRFYMAKLDRGWPKVSIIDEIYRSKERQQHQIRIKGLFTCVARYRLSKLTLARNFARRSGINQQAAPDRQAFRDKYPPTATGGSLAAGPGLPDTPGYPKETRNALNVAEVGAHASSSTDELRERLALHQAHMRRVTSALLNRLQDLRARVDQIQGQVSTIPFDTFPWTGTVPSDLQQELRPPSTKAISHIETSTKRIGRIYYWIDDTCTHSNNSGVQRVTRQLGKAITQLGVAIMPARWDRATKRLVRATATELEQIARWHGPTAESWTTWEEPCTAPQNSWLLLPEAVHEELPVVRDYARNSGLRCAALFYDAIPYKLGRDYGAAFAKSHGDYMETLLAFDKVFPISQHSRSDLIKFSLQFANGQPDVGQRVSAIRLPGEFNASSRANVYDVPALPHIQLLAVISIEPRKNPLGLLEAFRLACAMSPTPLRLTIVGHRIDAFSQLSSAVESMMAGFPGCTLEHNISEERLAYLYSTCHFTVYPSIEEGFGLPILESLWNGRPCICHGDGATLEVSQGGGCVLVDMREPHELATAIGRLANSGSERNKLAAQAIGRQFDSWRDYARTLVIELLDKRPSDLETVPNKL